MATKAAHPRVREAANEDSKPSSPKRWWQWILLYPAFAVALLTAGPQWYDRGKATWQGIKGGSASDAEKQASLWRKNLSCSAAPFAWFGGQRRHGAGGPLQFLQRRDHALQFFLLGVEVLYGLV